MSLHSLVRTPLARLLTAAFIVAGLQTGILGYIVASRAAILRTGAEVLLKTAPVDPRDLLRGDYVILRYDISTVPAATITGPRPERSGRQVLWVRLKKQPDGFWTVAQSSFGGLGPEADSVVVKTQAFHYYAGANATGDIAVEYGIERYYVPEGEGKALEQARGTEALSVAVRVSRTGAAQIRSLLLDGQPVYDEPLY